MTKRVPKPFTLLLFLFLLSNYLSASPDCPIVSARFSGSNGTTSDASATGWYLDASRVASTGYFAVRSNRLHAQELGGEGIWYSRVFSTAGYSEFQVAVKIGSEGDLNSSEYVKIFYKINGGAETPLDSRTGNFGTLDFISGTLTGSNVQLIVKIYNYNNGGSQTSKYYIEEYRVFKEKGPCTVSSINVTAAAANGGILTCSNTSLGLSATATGSGTTTWSWSGPNGFTSTLQNPVISTPGTYTVVATNSTGTGSASVTVTENKTPPVVTATGGALACGSCVSISATSNVSGATYSWTGPNNFTSSSQNPTVCAAGTYTVTVTNGANGCSAQQSVSVTSGTIATFWLEDFSGLSNGTTSDEGATAWTSSFTGSGTHSVQSNEFKTSFSGSQGTGVWSSQVIDISSKSNVTFSVDLRSATASSSDHLESADYIRVYYKLNGGAETLIFDDAAGIGSTTNTTASTTVTSSSLNGNTLQIIIKTSNSDPTERYFFDNIKVSGSNGGTGTATVTPSVNGTVTCTATAQLAATASSTVSAWSWTGPNGFTSSVQNPVVNAGGQYVVTATLVAGCTVSGTITVAENKTPPDITATGGTLACLPNITLNANSSVANATYSWTGPGNYTSNAKNPIVSTAGNYTVTVTNPANGCAAQQTVTVTAGGSATPTTFWLEDFSDLTDGSTSDSGPTAWTSATTSGGTYSVQAGEFKTSFPSGSQGTGTWTSQVIDISSKSNVTFSVYLKSGTATTNDAFENADYIRVYYKLNGGAETLVFEDLAGIGTTTNGTASTTYNSASLNGSTLQIIIKTSNSDPTERYYFDNVQLTGSDKSSEAVVATGGAFTCTTSSVTLLGNASAGGVTYSWTGPNNFTSTAQNPIVSATGIYTLTVFNPATGCSGSDTALVALNTAAPGASASAGGSLSCNGSSSVTLSGSSSTSGVTYSWTGPNNFTSTAQNPAVTVVGTYTLTVTNPVNGCTSTASTTVTMSTASTGTIWSEGFSLPNGSTSGTGNSWSITTNPSTMQFAVLNNELRATNSTTKGEGVWTTGVINITGKTNVTISASIRSSVINGVLMNNSGELADYLRFYYKLNNGPEVMFDEKMGIINNHSTTPTTISVAGLSGTSLQIVVRSRATANDEFYYIDNVQVVGTTQSALNAVATATDIISCTRSSVGLTGSSTATSPVNYSWTGPDNFTSTVQNPSATVEGIYTLTVTDQSTGCTGSDTALVSINTTPPGAEAYASGQISCDNGSLANLFGSSPTMGVTYSWTGPNNFTSAEQYPIVTRVGTYNLTVTNPVNGCTSTASAIVAMNNLVTGPVFSEDFSQLQNGTTSTSNWSSTKTPSSALCSVLNGEFRISNCGTNGGEGVWTSNAINIAGKSFINISAGVRSSIINNAVMNTDPTYGDYIRFYYKLDNGAEVLFAEKTGGINNHSTTLTPISGSGISSGNTLQIVVRARATGNDEFYYFDNMQVVATGAANVTATATGGSITCNNSSVTLQGNSAASGVSYNWSGPNGYTSTQQNPVVTVNGNYVLTVTLGSCTATATAIVNIDTIRPSAVVIPNPASSQITCINNNVILTGGSSTSGVNYSWSGASGVISNTSSINVGTTGTYILTVTNPANGCFTTASQTVTENTTPPANVKVSKSPETDIITCTAPEVTLTGSTTTTGVTYHWSGPEGYTASTVNASAAKGGSYIFTVTNPVNGCYTRDTTDLAENKTQPDGSATSNNEINCRRNSSELKGTSITPGVTYKWTGPGNFSATTPNALATIKGNYTLRITDLANGCIRDIPVVVIENKTPPVATATNNGPLSCAVPEVTLTGNSATPGLTYAWTGPDGFFALSREANTNIAGTYKLTVTDGRIAGNGCSNEYTTEVIEDFSDCFAAREASSQSASTTAKAVESNATVTSFTYKAYPNPVVNNNAVIEFTSPQNTAVTVMLYNALGTCEKVLFKGNVIAGQQYKVAVPAAQFHAGAYYYIINTGGNVHSGKLMIVK
jgi:hypothetical protein